MPKIIQCIYIKKKTDYSSNKIMEWDKFIDMKITSSFFNQLIFFLLLNMFFK